jgi:hypothetical protein
VTGNDVMKRLKEIREQVSFASDSGR